MMITRFTRKMNLYNQVLEEPNIMTNIVSHLSAKDVVHLIISNGNFTKEERFQDTIRVFLAKEKQSHDVRKQYEEETKQRMAFTRKSYSLIKALFSQYDIESRKNKFECLYDFLIENKRMMYLPYFHDFKQVALNKLFEFLQNDVVKDLMKERLLYYLDALFDIQVQTIRLPNAIVEYIEDGRGNRIWI